ncbi:MAG TPA: 16S rRNA (cytosine(1402)-N(4))-methyltransferase RsmH [Patescibacteria group bacterium]|nr:16S rRNA (cytosine(1402)-N(4))-methyltransferase RsmH [Patescibacteria group bacterium]
MLVKGEYHTPALLKETVDYLKVEPGKKFIDATLGGGGHSLEILKRGGELLAIDRDPEAIEYAGERLKKACPALHQMVQGKIPPPKVVRGNFADIGKLARENGFERVNGILFDLGVSSHQLEAAYRGFSFNLEGPLDMRMDPRLAVTAKDLVNALSEKELAELFWRFGEEKYRRRYARAVCRAREKKKIETVNELAQIILCVAPPRGKFDWTHPATRVFQALRIAVNDELESLREALPQAVALLEPKGRLVVLSFHSLEDGIIKRFFQEMELVGKLNILTEKPVEPTESEVRQNPRARSAKLRAAEKLED